MTLSVITVLYRSAAMLEHTLPTWAKAAAGRPVEFLFVDNSPDDGAAIDLGGTPFRYFPVPENKGFAGGCNLAFAEASGEHAFLLNPDVWLAADSIDSVLAAIAADPATPIAVGLAMHGREYVGIDVNPVSLFIDRRATAQRGPLGPSGGAAVLPMSLVRRFGGFREDLFAWGEDADLALRLYAGGVRTRCLNLSLRHASGHSVEGDRGLSEFRAFLLARNRILVAARTLSGPLLMLTVPLLVAAQGALALRRARQGLLRPFLRGVWHGLSRARSMRGTWRGRRFGIRTLATYLARGRS